MVRSDGPWGGERGGACVGQRSISHATSLRRGAVLAGRDARLPRTPRPRLIPHPSPAAASSCHTDSSSPGPGFAGSVFIRPRVPRLHPNGKVSQLRSSLSPSLSYHLDPDHQVCPRQPAQASTDAAKHRLFLYDNLINNTSVCTDYHTTCHNGCY